MKKFVTTFTAISMATMMAVSLVGCGAQKNIQDTTDAQESVINPIEEMSQEEMTERTGINLPLPEEATDVVYSVIDTGICQVEFTLNGDHMYLRACSTPLTELIENGEDIDFGMSEGNISGLNYEWDQGATNLVQDRAAVIKVSKSGPGYIAWIDVVPGILYNLCMEENASLDKLVEVANQVFVPLQGEVES